MIGTQSTPTTLCWAVTGEFYSVRVSAVNTDCTWVVYVWMDGCVYLLHKIIIAKHSYTHPGVYKTHQLIDRKYVFQEPGKDVPVKYSYGKLRNRISLVLASCQVCQAVKSRTGLQPDTLEAYPVPENPFSSISVDFCHLPLVSVGSVKYNSVFVIVCRLAGYVMALPGHESFTSAEVASLFLTRFVTFFGLPKEHFADNDKVLDAVFFSAFCELSEIEPWLSPVYGARSNGTAENAVSVVISSLRTLLEQCALKRKWVDILPLALWSANDIPRVITGYSPHHLVFGRDPIGFGDHPSLSPDFGCEDAHQCFKRVQKQRAFVRDPLSPIHEQKAQEFLKAHPPQRFEPGDRVWLKVVRRHGDNKPDRVWVGPAEVLERLSVGRLRVAGSYGPQDVESYRLKPYNPPHTHKQPPLHLYSDKGTLVDDDKFIIEKVLKHQKFANKGRDKHRRPHILEWYVKYKGYDKPEWHDASEFLHDINQDWLQYNIKHKIDVGIQDVCVLRSKYVSFWTRGFALVTARRFWIIVTLCTCVACTIVCHCFPFPSLCTGIPISTSSSDGELGSAYRFQVSVSAARGSGFWIPPPPPALQDSVFFSIFSPTDWAGGPSQCESGTVNLRPYFSLSFLLHACILSLRCAVLIQTASRSVIDRAKSCRSRCTKSRCMFIA